MVEGGGYLSNEGNKDAGGEGKVIIMEIVGKELYGMEY